MPIVPRRRTSAADHAPTRRHQGGAAYFLGRPYELYATRYGVACVYGRPAIRRPQRANVA